MFKSIYWRVRENLYLALILALGLLVRLYKINSPILDLYPIRQEQCAMIARNFFYTGLSIFNPQVDWFGSQDPSWRMELPLISYLASLLYKLFGVHECLGRLVAVGFSIGSIILFYMLLRLFYEKKFSLLALFFFTFSPLNVYFSRAFMPESLMLFFSLGLIYYFYIWIRNGQKYAYAVAALFGVFALLAKPFTVFLFIPLFYLVLISDNKEKFLILKLLIFFSICVIPAYGWYKFSDLIFSKLVEPIWNVLTSYEYCKRMLLSFTFFICTPIGLFLLFLGLLLKNNDRKECFFHVWFVSLLLFLFINAQRHFLHYYYQLPFVAVNSVFMAKSVKYLEQKCFIKDSIFYKYGGSRSFIYKIFIVFFLIGIISVKPFYNWNKNTYNSCKFIDLNLPKDALLIAGRCTGEAPLYYTNRKGWEINEWGEISYLENYFYKNRLVPELSSEIQAVDYLISKGANYYFSVNVHVWNENQYLVEYLRTNFRNIVDDKNLVIFDLSQKARKN